MQLILSAAEVAAMPCEVCGRPGAHRVTDAQVVATGGGRQMLTMHSSHVFCAEHNRQPVLYLGPGVQVETRAVQERPRFIGQKA